MNNILARIGFRGSHLAMLGCGFCAYGIGIVAGYRPTVLTMLGADLTLFGIAWIISGCLVLTGVVMSDRKFHFALAVFVMAIWALLLVIYWSAPQGWTASISWITLCLATINASGWPWPWGRKQEQP